jgi:hypothetical protein
VCGLIVIAHFLLLLSPSPMAAQELPDTLPLPPSLALLPGEEARAMPGCSPFYLLARGAPMTCCDLLLSDPSSALLAEDDVPSSQLQPSTEVKQPQKLLAALLSVGVLAGAAANSFIESPHQSFHVTHEGFFGQDTYAGGGDKASHFVDFSIVAKELANGYDRLGFSRRTSLLMGFGVSTLAGLVIELGDGITFYGFSYEDLMMDTLGAGTATVVAAARLDDLIGFRRGFLLPPSGNATCCKVPGKGRDYSNEIQTADLKIAGLARRLDLPVGPLRYLLFSVTYGTKSYPSGLPELRERQVGFEIGLNLAIILDDLGVRRDTWWGYTLHVVFDNFRVPFTSVGFRYDLNSKRWRGPDNGNGFATP